jgi:RNA polymerase sigma-70 factor (ECF subfamily)
MPKGDEEMLQAAACVKAGDRSEAAHFEELVRSYYKRVYNVAYRLTGNGSDAEDLTQEAFLRAYRSYASYNQGLPFLNWMYRIVGNLHIDRYRRKPKAKILSLDAKLQSQDGEVAIEVPDRSLNPEDAAVAAELGEEIQKALTGLPESFRTAVVLVDIEGLSYEETSDVMQTSIGTVRSRVFRGRQMLREKVGLYLAGA